jgi:hypothetical protein
MNIALYTHALTCLLTWTHPRHTDVARLRELQVIAVDIAQTDGDMTDAEVLAAVSIHESTAQVWMWKNGKRVPLVGLGGARGPFQVEVGPATAAGALALVRWSTAACGEGDLSLYAGCRTCGACPEIVSSLLDPTAPRR